MTDPRCPIMDDEDAYLANLAEVKRPGVVQQVQPCIHHLRSGKFEWSVQVWRDGYPFASFSIKGNRDFATEPEAHADMNATLALLNITLPLK